MYAVEVVSEVLVTGTVVVLVDGMTVELVVVTDSYDVLDTMVLHCDVSVTGVVKLYVVMDVTGEDVEKEDSVVVVTTLG